MTDYHAAISSLSCSVSLTLTELIAEYPSRSQKSGSVFATLEARLDQDAVLTDRLACAAVHCLAELRTRPWPEFSVLRRLIELLCRTITGSSTTPSGDRPIRTSTTLLCHAMKTSHVRTALCWCFVSATISSSN